MKYFFLITGLVLLSITVNAQPLSQGGGEYKIEKTQCLTPAQYTAIAEQLDKSLLDLRQKGIVPQTFSPQAVQFSFPLKQSASYNYPSFFGISNYFDHNAGFPNQITDYNCGTRSYDTDGGYNHQGIDYFLWPFDNLMMQREQVQIVAAEAGTILFKSDGNADQNCSFCSGCNWNAVYIVHADGSVAWYGHMKTNTLTTKAVGATVARGEYLGAVGSSGNSTGPHLHFEIYKAQPYTNVNLIDPYAGTCNTRNTQSWWQTQRAYQEPTINLIQTQTAPTSFTACPNNEVPNESSQFVQGQTVYFTAYYADQLISTSANYTVTRPDNSVFQQWTQNFTSTFSASWWWWSFALPSAAPTGTWNFRAVYNGQTVNYPFTVSVASGVTDAVRNLFGISTYPNPFVSEINLTSKQELQKPVFIIYNEEGREVWKQQLQTAAKQFTISNLHLPKGVYWLTVREKGKLVYRKQIMK
jgi:murein DD-endopeptidase MepM/ murein hydrolase activator NlpD